MAIAPLPQEIIRRKRDGEALTEAELKHMVRGMTDGSVTEGQLAALAMAIYFQGLGMAERVALTRAMTDSGVVLDWSDTGLDGPVLDKHSTGGVGDKVSLMLAPMVAACGGYVPMISGRGLGHTGGTLDKLDSIPGYDSTPDIFRFRQVVAEVGCAIIGQTDELAPADRRFYAIRDVTATIESVGLITASILSKKLAAGLQGLVMDVKTGSGAFLRQLDASRELAESIVTVARGAGLPATALITDMNQVLGRSAGNALEIRETIDYLTGRGERNGRLHQIVLALGAEMLCLGRLAAGVDEARDKLVRALDDGRAAERFARMVTSLGGPSDLLEAPGRHLPRASVVKPVPSPGAGFVASMDTRALGIAIVALGGGRLSPGDAIAPAVGLSDVCRLGARVEPGQPLALVYARNEAHADAAVSAVNAAIRLGEEAPTIDSVVYERVGRMKLAQHASDH
jgi:thymidine phosphorylase